MNARARTVATLGLLAAATTLSGCIWQTDRHARISRNPTPELVTLYQRPVDVQNALTVTFDENARMITQDLGRFFYTNRPSRLTREPMPRP